MPVAASLLTDLPLFESLGRDERALLAGVVDLRTVPAGEFLFKAGDPGQAMYIVVSGRSRSP
ncbi:MAG: cyclic nucleotide-binding domain-containing protein [Holophagaceae bacterium]|nr:cyclic nucleotide-binding domain-containing protein [Holophagaceae bacterium]